MSIVPDDDEDELKEDEISLEECIEGARTGDIVLLSGIGTFSDIVRMVSESDWSHVGIIIRKGTQRRPLLFHSTMQPTIKDLQSGTMKDGPQINDLEHYLNEYGAHKIAYRRLHVGDKNKKRARLKRRRWTRRLLQFQEEVNDLPYEMDIGEMARSAYASGTDGGSGSYFCTELVADAMMRMGILDSTAGAANSYMLDEFTSSRSLPLKGSVHYDDELYIK